MATSGLYGNSPNGTLIAQSGTESTGLYGKSPNGSVVAAPGSDTSGLYGNAAATGGTYFEWFVFQESVSQPATPTGGSWNFTTNIGTPPSGWSLQPPVAPVYQVWVSIALVNSRATSTLTWSTPGLLGVVPNITFGTVITGAPGTNAAVVNTGTATNPNLIFTIPRGATGNTGATGATGATGPTGATGAAATIAAGTTTTGAAGTYATVTNVGTSGAAIFNFVIPRGDTGATGATGAQGIQGNPGAAATIAVGTTSTGSPGSTASVNNTGTSSAAVFNFSIPRGDTGATGPAGAAGAGVATGGTTGQVLTKASGTNYDTTWTTIPVTSVNGKTGTVNLGYADLTGAIPTWNQNTTGTAANVTGVVAVANGGTGVTTSSGANSVVLRDANANITTNCLFEGFSSQAASGTAIVLTASSVQNWQITGSGGQVIRLPNATTLPNGATFTFNNNQSSGAITVQNNSSTTVATINSGGYVTVVLLDNSIAAGSWDRHDSTPSNVSWSTNTLDYPGSITSATWNGTVVAVNRGGTGASTAAGALTNLGAYPASNPNGYTNNTGTVTSVAATAGTGISITGSPITTSGTLNITNTAPDQTVAIASGTGISVTGTYPNFTVTNTSPSSGGTVTSVSGTTGRITSTGGNTPVIDLASGIATAGTTGSSTLIPVVTIDTYGRVTSISTASNPQGTVTSVTGTSPVVSSGGATPAISMAAATASVDGYLTATDWNTFNNKGSGSVTSVATGTGLTGGPITSSGTISIDSTVATLTGTQTLSNKRIDPRVTTAATASSLTPSIATADVYAYTALASGLTINAPTGTPLDGDKLIFRLLDNGTARALTWDATYTVIGTVLPTTTVISKTTYVGCIYNANNTRWDVIAVTTQA